MAEEFLRMARKWLEGAAELRQETVTRPFTKTPGKRMDELISGSLKLTHTNKKAGCLLCSQLNFFSSAVQ